eukprot:471546_1
MGNKISNNLPYHTNDIISVNFLGLTDVNKASYLTVFGFMRKYCKINNLTISYPVICIVLLFYYDETNIPKFITLFDRNYYDDTKWNLSKDNKTIKGIFKCNPNYFGSYCVYCSDNGYNKGIYYVAIKYKNGRDDRALCSIGVTSKHIKNWNTKNGYWIKEGEYSYFNGSHHKPYWNISETIIIKLDLNNLIVHYYKKKKKKIQN